MKVFLSWSKPLSRVVAEQFAQWLPIVIQECSNPFISTDIEKGEPWFETITSNLKETDLGLVFITAENKDATWLNFEAGAMLNKFGKSGVCPVLVGLKKENYDGPMKNLQLVEVEDRDDMFRLLQTVNARCDKRLEVAVLKRAFQSFWSELEAGVQKASTTLSERDEGKLGRGPDEKIDEILNLVRGLSSLEQARSDFAVPVDLVPSQPPKEIRTSRYQQLLDAAEAKRLGEALVVRRARDGSYGVVTAHDPRSGSSSVEARFPDGIEMLDEGEYIVPT
ncbi:hypothetical protein IWX64_001447 [Arthrobacter sp. CAN_A212]|uniref:TIR domain-containing protein n=1 Tax=Arthrobacter sp. CAN_A212 TaxID=2787719 RepID=UPI0018C9760A